MPRQLGSNQTRGYRRVTSQAVTQDNQLITVDIPRGPHIESMVLRIFGTITITTTFTAVRAFAAFRFLRRLDWVLNSNVTLDSVSGLQIAQLMACTRRRLPFAINPAGFGVSAQPFDMSFIFDRALMDMVRPKDSLLKTDVGVANLQARIQLGTLADFFTGAGVANYSGGVTAELSIADYQEARNSEGNTPSPLYYVKRNGLQQVFSAAGQQQQIKLNTGNRLRIVSVVTLNGTTQEPDATILTAMRLKRAGDTRVDMSALTMRNTINVPAYGTGLNGLITPTAHYVIDLANNGQLGVKYTEFWPIPSSADTFLEVDLASGGILDIATLEGVDL